jgi:hypothetical protein
MRGVQRTLHHRRIGNHGDIGPRFCDPRPADRRQFAALRQLLFHRVQPLVLDEQHRLAEPDRAFQKAISLGGSRRRDHDEPRHVDEPGFEALRVLGGGASRRARLRTHYQGNRELAAGHVAILRGLIHQAIHRQRGEIDEHDFEHRLETTQCGSGGKAGNGRFADGRVAYARDPMFLREAPCDAERAPRRDVLAQEIYRRIARQFLVERSAQDLDERVLHGLARNRGEHRRAVHEFKHG